MKTASYPNLFKKYVVFITDADFDGPSFTDWLAEEYNDPEESEHWLAYKAIGDEAAKRNR